MPQSKSLFMENTEVKPEKTAAEVAACLIQAGAKSIATDYIMGKVTGLRWTMEIHKRDVLFAMPTRVEPVYQILRKRRVGYIGAQDEINLRAKAERVAWRQLLRWTQAQMAMIDCGMVKPAEVFMPYIEFAPGQSMFAALETGHQKLGLGSGEAAR